MGAFRLWERKRDTHSSILMKDKNVEFYRVEVEKGWEQKGNSYKVGEALGPRRDRFQELALSIETIMY